MKIAKYTLCVTSESHYLVTMVNEMIEDGWQPIGGVASHAQRSSSGFMQAMVKYESPSEPNLLRPSKDDQERQ